MSDKKNLETISERMFIADQNVLKLLDLIETNEQVRSDEEVTEVLNVFLEKQEKSKEEFDKKLNSYAWLIQKVLKDAEMLKERKLALEKRQKTLENFADRLKSSLQFYLYTKHKKVDLADKESKKSGLSYSTEDFKFSVRRVPPVLVIKEGTQVAHEYCRQTWVVDKDSIKEALENGKEVENCFIDKDRVAFVIQ